MVLMPPKKHNQQKISHWEVGVYHHWQNFQQDFSSGQGLFLCCSYSCIGSHLLPWTLPLFSLSSALNTPEHPFISGPLRITSPGNGSVSAKSFTAIKLNSNHLSADLSGADIKENKCASDYVTKERGRRALQIAYCICLPPVCFLPFSVDGKDTRSGTTGQLEICTHRCSSGTKSQASLHQQKGPL